MTYEPQAHRSLCHWLDAVWEQAEAQGRMPPATDSTSLARLAHLYEQGTTPAAAVAELPQREPRA